MTIFRSRNLFVFIGILALWLAAQSSIYFLSELFSYKAKQFERSWESTAGVSDIKDWETAREHIERALALNSGNPDTWLRAGRIYEWYGFTPLPDADLRIKNLRNARDAVDEALMLRSHDGYALSARAVVKVRSGQADGSLSMDIVTALQLAPWETTVQERLAMAGLAAWQELDDGGRQSVVGLYESLLRHRPRTAERMQQRAGEYGLEYVFSAAEQSDGD
jgi:tetratricopeptide (TPR) repeat protein